MAWLANSIETFLKTDNLTLTAMAYRQFFTSLISHQAWPAATQALRLAAQQKQVFFIRHAESQINQWLTLKIENYMLRNVPKELRNPKLTPLGEQQCRLFSKQYGTLEVDLTFVSPFLRTRQTYRLLSQAKGFISKACIVTHLIRERSDIQQGVIGTPCEDSPFITKQRWWRNDSLNSDDEMLFKQSRPDYDARLKLFWMWAMSRQQKRIALVSHACVYDWLFGKGLFSIENCGLAEMNQQQKLKILSQLTDTATL